MSSYISLAPYYDDLTDDVPYGGFADFYEAVFKEYGIEPGLVLDLACGTGTLTCIMAERGYELIGTDASPEMLAEAYGKSSELENCVKPVFLCQTMEDLDLYGTVSAAFCSLDGINYVPKEELDEVFGRLRLFIEPGGVFVFDVIVPEKLREQDGDVYIDEGEDVYCVWRPVFDEDENACVYGMDVFCRKEDDMWMRGSEEHIEYAHSIDMLCEKLGGAGFGDLSVYRDHALDSGRRIFIAARRI